MSFSRAAILAVLLVSAGAVRGDTEPESSVTNSPAPNSAEAKKAPAKKSAARKSKTDSAAAAPKGKAFSPGAEGPSSDHPDWPLALWSDGPAVAWRVQAGACAAEAEKLIAGLEKSGSKKAIKQRIAAVNRAYVLIVQLARFSALLKNWSETAGVELELRHDQLPMRLAEQVLRIQNESPQLVSNEQDALGERCRQAQKTLDQIRKARQAGKLEAAEAKLIKLYDDLAIHGAWLPPPDVNSPLNPFNRLMFDLAGDLLPQRQQAARDAMKRYRDEQMPNYAELLAQVATATSAASTGKKFDLSGQMLDAPQALEQFLSRWQELLFKTLHVRAMDCARAQFASVRDDASTAEPYRKFETDLAAALVKLIDADTGSVKAAEIAGHYAAYVHALAPVLSLAADDARTQQFQAALGRLAAKSPPLAAQLDTYRQATSDLLRWRARLAAAQRARAEPREAAATSVKVALKSTAPALIRDLAAELVGKPSVGLNLIGTPAGERAASAMAKDQTYCVVALDARLQAASASLRAALLSTSSSEPLTLPAAMALASAERGDLAAVGGPVERIELESVIPLWAHADTWGLARLDRQPDQTTDLVRLRIELQPRWYYQTHAFVEIEPEQP
jgi:hypothetical protein